MSLFFFYYIDLTDLGYSRFPDYDDKRSVNLVIQSFTLLTNFLKHGCYDTKWHDGSDEKFT